MPKSATRTRIRIGELARRVGATPRTVRYYEELGLLPGGPRRQGSHRVYDAGDEARLAELIRIRDLLGLSLADLRGWAAAEEARAELRERWEADPSERERAQIATEAREPLETQLALVRARREALEELEDELVSKRRRVREILHELSDRSAAS
jgi:MerR family transcriptional regulator, repressor of the yfmOP operon